MFMRIRMGLLAAGIAAFAAIAIGEEQTQKHQQSQQLLQGSFFGPQLLSEDEQAAYRARIRNADTTQEIERIRAEHYELMKVRSKEKGVALPEKRPPAGGSIGNIFTHQLMSEEERAAYRARMRSAKTNERFEQIRTERQVEIVARAKENGAVLPDSQQAVAGGSGGVGVFGTIFGPQLMTEAEQAAYRARLRGAGTQEERDKIRSEHRQQLQSRAKDKGIALSK